MRSSYPSQSWSFLKNQIIRCKFALQRVADTRMRVSRIKMIAMKKLIICTRRDETIPQVAEEGLIVVTEKEIGKCRGCLACRRVKKCITYLDDAQKCIPVITEATHIDIYLQPEGSIQRLMDRILYALDGTGKTFSFHINDNKEEEYLRHMLLWCKYTEVQ